MHSNVRSEKKKWIIIAVLAIVVVLLAAFGIYTGRYYHADEAALAAFSTGSAVTASGEGNMLTYSAGNPDAGLVFYPGGKVEHTAYEPLMKACAARGMACTLIKMPFNLAVLDMNAADGIQERYPEIERWYIGGHSLGASMAASYARSIRMNGRA